MIEINIPLSLLHNFFVKSMLNQFKLEIRIFLPLFVVVGSGPAFFQNLTKICGSGGLSTTDPSMVLRLDGNSEIGMHVVAISAI